MQQPAQELTHGGGERRALAALSWLVLAASLTCAALSVRGFLMQAEPEAASGPAPTADAPLVRTDVAAAPPRPSEPALRNLRIVGVVRSEDDEPIAGARVEVDADAVRSLSGPDGAYTLPLRMREGRSPRLRFSAPGYEEKAVRLDAEALRGFAEAWVDATLVRAGSRAQVTGFVRDARGNPIAGETVQLQGSEASARYADVTDDAGAFSIPRVRVGGGFELVVQPRSGHADHRQRGLTVPESGLELEVVLEPLTTRRLAGRVVDAEGRPVPGFGLSVRGEGSRERMTLVHGDASGRFAVEGVPEGTLHLASLSGPYHVIRGVPHDGETADLEVVVDAGNGRLGGRVVDAEGRPVAGAQVDLAWLHTQGSLRSSSIRRSTTDAEGAFRFEGLGPGPHRVSARAALEGAARPIEVPADTDEVEVRLDPPRR